MVVGVRSLRRATTNACRSSDFGIAASAVTKSSIDPVFIRAAMCRREASRWSVFLIGMIVGDGGSRWPLNAVVAMQISRSNASYSTSMNEDTREEIQHKLVRSET